jgi:hypothetical protein
MMQNDIPEKAHAFQGLVGLVDPAPLDRFDNKIRETEQIVSEIEPQDINERPEDRVAEFLRELRRTLRQRLDQEPQNKIWYEAVLLLDIPRSRASVETIEEEGGRTKIIFSPPARQ